MRLQASDSPGSASEAIRRALSERRSAIGPPSRAHPEGKQDSIQPTATALRVAEWSTAAIARGAQRDGSSSRSSRCASCSASAYERPDSISLSMQALVRRDDGLARFDCAEHALSRRLSPSDELDHHVDAVRAKQRAGGVGRQETSASAPVRSRRACPARISATPPATGPAPSSPMRTSLRSATVQRLSARSRARTTRARAACGASVRPAPGLRTPAARPARRPRRR